MSTNRQRRDCIGLGLGLGTLAALGAAPACATAQAPTPQASAQRVQAGRLERLADFASRLVQPRHVEVWLPPGYDGSRPHAVLYMQDGQMLFDADSTWNHQAWAVDRVAAPLLAQGRLRDFIVVGIWNGGRLRRPEYYPQAFLAHLQPPALRQQFIDEFLLGRPLADAYLRFLVEELKPVIDARYATDARREATFVMGSSMGGLISVYALCEYPQVFAGAAALSTHWIGWHRRNPELPAAALAYLIERLPAPAQVRLYMDRGTTELDALYDQAQPRVDALLAAKGFRAPGFASLVFEGAGHKELDWQRRLDRPLAFLLGSAA